MKKTMFITSVIMVVVMAIALTTSSLAWFTAAGSSTVTTNSLTLTAAAPDAAGIQISSKSGDEAFGKVVSLATGDSFASLMPIVPVIADGTGDNAEAIAASKLANIIAAMDDTLDFVGNKIVYVQEGETPAPVGYFAHTTDDTTAADQKYTAEEGKVFAKNIWIRNIGVSATKVTPSIKFYRPDGDDDDSLPDEVTATATSNVDPILNVAVLSYEDSQWNLVQLFSNSGTKQSGWVVTSLNRATAASNLNSGNTVSGKVTSLSSIVTSFSGSSKTAGLAAPAVDGNGATTYYPVQFRVVAWYDGDSLNNSTNNGANLMIELTFADASAS